MNSIHPSSSGIPPYSPEEVGIIEKAARHKEVCTEILPTDPLGVPQWLRATHQFGLWSRANGTNKMAFGERGGKLVAGSNGKGREAEHLTFERAIQWQIHERQERREKSVTFFSGNGTTALDLDLVMDPETGETIRLALEILGLAARMGAYIEKSPSGTGFKIFGRLNRVFCNCQTSVKLPPILAENGNPVLGKNQKTISPGFEAYLDGRHNTLTGQVVVWPQTGEPRQDEPVDLLPLLELIESRLGIQSFLAPNSKSSELLPSSKAPNLVHQGGSIAEWFNQHVNFYDWLISLGCKEFHRAPGKHGGVDIYFTRPGKDKGVSLVLGSNGELVYLWTDNLGAPPQVGMSKFRFWAWYFAGGDERAAARTLGAWKRDKAIGSIPTMVIPEGPQPSKGPNGLSAPNSPPAFNQDPTIGADQREKLEWVPFPVAVLPDLLRKFVEETAREMGCDPSMVALPALAVAASAVGLSRVMRVRRTWKAPCILWAAVISESGTKKSPPFDAAIDPVKKIHRKRFKEWQEKKKAWKKEHARWKAAEAKFSNGRSAVDPGPEPEMPTMEFALANDCTVSKLIQNLGSSPRGLLLARDELSAWIASFQKQGTTSDMPYWLGMHNGETIIRDRVGLPGSGGEHVCIPRAAVSICGGIQPGIMKRALTQEHSEAGLDARMIAAMPPKGLDRWREEELSPETEASWEKLIKDLFELEMGLDEEGFPIPKELEMAPKARKRWIAFYDEWARRKFVSSGAEASLASKLEGTVPRLALLFHLIDQAEHHLETLEPVGDLQMERAIELVEWFLREWARIRQELGREPDKIESRLVDLVKKSGKAGLFKSQIHQAFSNNLKKEVLDAKLNELLNQGQLICEKVETGGRPGERWLASEFQNPA